PVHVPASLSYIRFKFFQIEIEIAHHMRFGSAGSSAELLPIRQLAHNFVAFIANDVGGVAHVVAQLAIFQRMTRGFLKRRRLCRLTNADAHANGSPSVEASTSAMCAVFTPVRPRCSEPKICIRHELSVAMHNSASVSRMVRTLSASMA